MKFNIKELYLSAFFLEANATSLVLNKTDIIGITYLWFLNKEFRYKFNLKKYFNA